MDDYFVMQDFTVDLAFEELRERIRIEDEDDIALMTSRFNEALSIAKLKAVYRVCDVDRIEGDVVTVGGTAFQSAVMAKNFEGIHRVFAYVMTCGTEVDDWSHLEKDYFIYQWLDALKELMLRKTRIQFFDRVKKKHGIEKVAAMNPGSGNADLWPLQQQPKLFSLIGGVKENTGVTLTKDFLMLPTKSVSGILFPSDRSYVNCALCTRENCVGRKAPYNPGLMD